MRTQIMRRKHARTLLVLVVMGLALLAGICGGSAAIERRGTRDDIDATPKRLSPAEQQMVEQSLNRAGAGPFAASLEMKENVDFLLTPALLVQEIISEGVVVTYPSE